MLEPSRRPFVRAVRLSWFSIIAWSALVASCSSGNAARAPFGRLDIDSITVPGSGDASGTPDLARVTLGVEARARALEDAMREATQRMSMLRERLRGLGIPDAKLKTSNYSITQ